MINWYILTSKLLAVLKITLKIGLSVQYMLYYFSKYIFERMYGKSFLINAAGSDVRALLIHCMSPK